MANISKLTLLAASLLLFQVALAQGEGFDRPINPRQTQEQSEIKTTPMVRAGTADAELQIKKLEGYPAKEVPKEYSGYRIEIMVADSLLAADDDLFFRHGNMMLEPLSDNRFSYTVGDFRDAEVATSFLQQFILPKYQEARVVSYQDGRRK